MELLIRHVVRKSACAIDEVTGWTGTTGWLMAEN